MPRPVDYDASETIPAAEYVDRSTLPSFPLSNRLRRACWNLCHALLYRVSPRPMHGWRAFLLRCFGARLGPNCHFYPKSVVWAPWNLHCADHVAVADGVEIYNPSLLTLGSHVILSQNSYVCGATHDFRQRTFPLLAYRMTLGDYAWICARASVGPGVQVGEGAVLGLGSVATRDLDAWTVYAGNPARPVSTRPSSIRHDSRGVPGQEDAAP